MTEDHQQRLHHKFNPVILRKYDVRGIYGEQLNEEDAYFFGLAYATYLLGHEDKNYNTKLVVGMDGRTTSPGLKSEFIRGAIDAGIDVIDVGLVSSPMVNFGAYHFNALACCAITASHNPKEYNGFKFDYKNAPFFDEKIQELQRIADDCVVADKKGKVATADIEEAYLQHLMENFKFNADRKIRVCFDCGNGATGRVVEKLAKMLTERFGVDTKVLFSEIDGNFPNHHPDPTVQKNMNALAKIVVAEGFDLGIGFDGDGDRVGIIDETGRLLYGDEILLLFAKEVLKSRPGAKIVGEVKASKVLYDGIRVAGGEAIMTKIGNTYIRAKMDEVGAILGGETSGHIFFVDNLGGVDDGIVAGLKMIEILAEISSKGQKISDLVKEIPQVFATHDLKLPIDEADKFVIIDRISAILKQEDRDFIDIDGIRIDTNGGWWMLRASNTSAVLTGRCESDTAAGLEDVKKEFLEYVKKGGYAKEVSFDE